MKKMLEPQQKDAEKIKLKLDEINQKMQALSTELYQKASQEYSKQQGGQQGQQQEQEGDEEEEEKPKKKGKKGKVVDADYKEEK